ATGATPVELPQQGMAVNCVRFSPDARLLAGAGGGLGSNDRGQGGVFGVETQASRTILEIKSSSGASTVPGKGEVSPRVVNGQADLWNLQLRRLVGSARANKSVVAAASFSPDNPALSEVDFVATQPAADEGNSANTLLDFLIGGRRP